MTVVAGSNDGFGHTTEQSQVKPLSVTMYITSRCSHKGKKQVHRGDDRSRPRDLKSLSRHLRGGARPSEVIPDLHGIVISKLEALEYIQDMHEGGNKAALASSTRAFIGDVSTTISDLKKPGDLALPSAQLLEDGLDLDVLGAASDSDIAEYFDMDFFSDMIWQLQDLDKILREVGSLLENQDSVKNDQVSKESQQEESSSQVPVSSRERRLGEEFAWMRNENSSPLDTSADWFDRLLQDEPASTSSQYDDNIPLVCLDQCAPTNATCLCERLVGCVRDMTHFDLAVLFANGFINDDGQISGNIRLFNAADNAWETFVSIMNTANHLDPSNPTQCTDFLEQFHQPCNTLDEQTCSSENVRSFQLSVDQVCEFIDR